MTLVLVALGAFLAGCGVTAFVARYFLLLGWEQGRDDRALDPGEVTGSLETVGESSGKHALPDWPATENTERFEPVRVPAVLSEQDRREIAADSLFVDTQDAATRYREDHQ